MTARALLGGLVASIFGLALTCAAGSALLLGGGDASCLPATPDDAAREPGGGPPAIGRFDAEQTGNARTITAVGIQAGVPLRGWIIAVATAIQESGLRNLPGGDRDSIGLFQQRPSQGWGTPEQLRDPTYQAGKFYTKLLTVPGWQHMTLADAAQAVQVSAYPHAYAQHEADAVLLVTTTVGSDRSWAIPGDLEQCLSNCPPIWGSSSPPPSPSDGGCGTAVLTRAESWLTAWNGGPVPYLSSGNPGSWFQGYRRDCSGYVSMALELPGPGLDTRGLAARSTPLSKLELRAGDLLINPSPDLRGHVVIFERWTDASTTSYLGYEQSGDGGTHHRVIPYPYFGDYPMNPYRFAR